MNSVIPLFMLSPVSDATTPKVEVKISFFSIIFPHCFRWNSMALAITMATDVDVYTVWTNKHIRFHHLQNDSVGNRSKMITTQKHHEMCVLWEQRQSLPKEERKNTSLLWTHTERCVWAIKMKNIQIKGAFLLNASMTQSTIMCVYIMKMLWCY